MSKKVTLNYDILYKLYVEDLLPKREIALIMNVSLPTINRNILDYNLVRDEIKFKQN